MSDDLKDDAEVEKPSIDSMLESWHQKFGEERHTKAGVPYWHLDTKEFMEAFSSLLNSLLYAGYTESEVRETSLLKKLHEDITADVTSTAKLNIWKEMVTKTWKHVLAKQFANKDLIRPATNYAAEDAARAKERVAKGESDDTPPEPYVPPQNKLDPDKFEGYGDAQVVYDEDFAKLFEALKDE